MTDLNSPARTSLLPWVHLLGSPIVWALHFLVGYSWVEFACKSRLLVLQSTLMGLTITSHVVLLLTLIALVAIGYVAWSAYRRWRQIQQIREKMESAHWVVEGERFMAFSGMVLCFMFAATILLTGLPALVLRPC